MIKHGLQIQPKKLSVRLKGKRKKISTLEERQV